jgi:hypothetical protein
MYTVDYYLAIKKNEIMSFAGKWMELDRPWNKSDQERQIPHVLSQAESSLERKKERGEKRMT